MRIMMLILVIGALGFGVTALAMPGVDVQKSQSVSTAGGGMVQSSPGSPHGDGNRSIEGDNGMAGVIQRATLPGYKNMTIGEAFGKYGYFKKKEWRETGANGKFFVDFTGYAPTGWLDFKMRRAGISARGVEVKFVVYSDGAYGLAMVSNVEVRTDGKTNRSPRADAKKILDAIYANRKIDLY